MPYSQEPCTFTNTAKIATIHHGDRSSFHDQGQQREEQVARQVRATAEEREDAHHREDRAAGPRPPSARPDGGVVGRGASAARATAPRRGGHQDRQDAGSRSPRPTWSTTASRIDHHQLGTGKAVPVNRNGFSVGNTLRQDQPPGREMGQEAVVGERPAARRTRTRLRRRP